MVEIVSTIKRAPHKARLFEVNSQHRRYGYGYMLQSTYTC